MRSNFFNNSSEYDDFDGEVAAITDHDGNAACIELLIKHRSFLCANEQDLAKYKNKAFISNLMEIYHYFRAMAMIADTNHIDKESFNRLIANLEKQPFTTLNRDTLTAVRSFQASQKFVVNEACQIIKNHRILLAPFIESTTFQQFCQNNLFSQPICQLATYLPQKYVLSLCKGQSQPLIQFLSINLKLTEIIYNSRKLITRLNTFYCNFLILSNPKPVIHFSLFPQAAWLNSYGQPNWAAIALRFYAEKRKTQQRNKKYIFACMIRQVNSHLLTFDDQKTSETEASLKCRPLGTHLAK